MKPINKILVQLPEAFQDEISLEGGLKLYIDSSYNKEWNATVTGVVTHLPDSYDDQFKDIMSQIEVGDEVAFSFRVVADFDYHSDSDHFMLVTPEESPYLRKYTNKKGEWINLRAIPTTFGHMWAAWLNDKRMRHVDGVQGDESVIERWMSQFSFGKTDAYYFRNRLFLNGVDYWKVDFEHIFAVKKKGRWLSLGEKVLCKPIEADASKAVQIAAGIHIPDSAIKLRFYDRGRLIHNVPEMGLKTGEVIGFNQQYVEKYDLDGQPYFLIKKVRIDNKWPEIFRTSTI